MLPFFFEFFLVIYKVHKVHSKVYENVCLEQKENKSMEKITSEQMCWHNIYQ